MATLHPYLNFDTNCREAMNFYKDCFGGELFLQTVAESPEMAAQMPPDWADKVLHATLTSGDLVLMASDLNRNERVEGNTVHLCINCQSDNEITTFFSRLSEGGTIVQPLGDVPWGAKYAELTDKYGKHWLLNYHYTV